MGAREYALLQHAPVQSRQCCSLPNTTSGLLLVFHRQRRADHTPLEIAGSFADIYFCGGRVPCQCPTTALACIEVDDPDSCEAKWRSQLPCESWDGPLRSDARISARTLHGSLWFFPMDDVECDPTASVGQPTACVDNARTVSQVPVCGGSLASGLVWVLLLLFGFGFGLGLGGCSGVVLGCGFL